MSEKSRKEPFGRPLEYTPEIGDRICELVATHPIGLPRLCEMYPELPAQSTINRWRYQIEDFRDKYTESKRFQSEILAEEILEISDYSERDTSYDKHGNAHCDSEWVMRSRLRVDSRKWLASKLAPKIYGEKQQVENKVTISHEESLKELE